MDTDDAAKTQKKSLPPHLTPGNPGNSGGKPGRSGRIPSAFKDFLAKIRQNPKALKALERAATDEKSRNFAAAWKLISEYDDEKPTAKHEVVGQLEVSVRIAREGRRITSS